MSTHARSSAGSGLVEPPASGVPNWVEGVTLPSWVLQEAQMFVLLMEGTCAHMSVLKGRQFGSSCWQAVVVVETPTGWVRKYAVMFDSVDGLKSQNGCVCEAKLVYDSHVAEVVAAAHYHLELLQRSMTGGFASDGEDEEAIRGWQEHALLRRRQEGRGGRWGGPVC